MTDEVERIQQDLEKISGYHFENLVAEVWEARGWDASVTSKSGDFGVDVIAQKDEPYPQKHVIQAKCYAAGNPVSGPDVREIAGLHQQVPDTDAVIIVTSSRFTDNAREVAERTNVKLIDGTRFAELVSDASCVETVWKYRDLSITANESAKEKRERLYELFCARTLQSDIRDEGPRVVNVYLPLNDGISACYEHLAYSHTANELDEERAARMRNLVEREGMSLSVDYTELGKTSISAMKTEPYEKGTEEYLEYNFAIAEEIIEDVYGLDLSDIQWAVITDNFNVLTTWTEY